MWPWLLGIIGEAAAQATGSQPSPDELASALATVGQWAMGLGGAGGAGAGGVSLYLWRDLRSQVEAMKTRNDDQQKAIAALTENAESQRAMIGEMQSAVATLATPTEADQQVRDRLTRLESQHAASDRYLASLDTSVQGVRDLLLRAGGRGG